MGFLIKKSMNIIFMCVLLLFCNSCKKSRFSDDELHLFKQDYKGNQLRIDGYYFRKEVFDGEETGVPFFLYKNGIILNLGGFDVGNQNEWEQNINGSEIETARNHKMSWGIFIIEGSLIKFEKWYPSNSRNLPAYIREGIILNDTTFKITKSYRMQNGKKTETDKEDELYYFKHFSPKPDSTNTFIK